MAALRYSHVALMLIDGREGAVARTELSIASEVLSQGRALVVAVNKCDDIPSFEAARDGVEDVLSHQLAQGGDLTVVPISAIDGTNVDQLVCCFGTLCFEGVCVWLALLWVLQASFMRTMFNFASYLVVLVVASSHRCFTLSINGEFAFQRVT